MRINFQLPKLWLLVNGVSFEKNLTLGGWPAIFRAKNAAISIGSNCTINSNLLSNLIGLYQRTIIVARDKGEIIIGDNVGISGSTIYSRKCIQIGSNTLIGANCKIMDNDFHNVDSEIRNDFSQLKLQSVVIGNNVFIGCNSIILKGTKLGDNCVVGAGSVVHGEFEDNSIIAGNPARVIGKIDSSKK